MKTIEYKKQCNPDILQSELQNAGFEVLGISTYGGILTKVHLTDTETKDSSLIVENHIYTAPETYEKLVARHKKEYLALKTDAERINFLAKQQGLI